MEICDFIEFNIYGKTRRIELCLGDITNLSIKDSVDLLLISAFQDNYMPIKGTLIGSLNDKFKLSVKSLAKDKKEDLRKKFNCWISKDLPYNLPFRRILCFEQNLKNSMREDQSNLVGAMFRALFTTFKDNEWSIITPILATGNQKSDKTKMLNEMVRACSAWIAAEMPLTCMKIVIYKDQKHKQLSKEDNEAIEQFAKLKSEINWKPYKNLISIKYDAIFFYVKEDENIINLFLETLTGYSNDVFTIKLKCLNKDNYVYNLKSYEMYEKYQRNMLESRKVALFLSVNFLEHIQAIEVYNLALCLSQKTQKSLLTPICLNHINSLPEYMTLHQWIDCKMKSNEINNDKLRKGAFLFFEILEHIRSITISNENKTDFPTSVYKEELLNNDYDIFISYAHKDAILCNIILNFLESLLPNIKIFYDRNDIKTGHSWQEIIYNSLNGSKIVLSLLSENYIESSMCRDEFNIAISQHQSLQFNTQVFPIWISNKSVETVLSDYPKCFHKSFLMNNIFIPSFPVDSLELLSKELQILSFFQFILMNFIKPILQGENIKSYFSFQSTINLEKASMIARTNFFKKTWSLKENIIFKPSIIQMPPLIKIERIIKANDIAIGFHIDDLHYADYIKTSILKLNKELRIIFCSIGPNSNEWKSLKDIETANLIIILMKPFYIMTKSCRDQLHIALSLQRRNLNYVLPIILETIPFKPSFLHLLPSRFNSEDEIYIEVGKKFEYSKQNSSITYNSKVTKRFAIMLTFTSYWIVNEIFFEKFFHSPKTFVIYSTYDLINTNFDSPCYADVDTIIKQIKMLEISKEDINKARSFQCEKISTMNFKNDINRSLTDKNDEFLNSNKYSNLKITSVPSQVITKICLLM